MSNRLSTLCLLFSLISTAKAATSFGSAQEFLSSIPDLAGRQSLVALGDLDGNGTEDAAVVAVTGSGGEQYRQLVILLRDKSGSLSVSEASDRTQVPGAGCCWTEAVSISNGSVYVESHAGTYHEREVAVHQFKFYKGSWRLLGVRIVSTKSDESEEQFVRDINVLTGIAHCSATSNGKPVRKWRTNQPVRTYELKSFDFFNGFGAREP